MRYLYSALVIALMLQSCSGETQQATAEKKPLNEIYEKKKLELLSNFDEINSFDIASGIASAERNDLWGYIDTSGKEILPCKNYAVQSFSDGLGLVEETEGHFYFIDASGKKVLDLANYKNAFSFSNGYATVEGAGGYGLIDKTGKEVIPCKYDEGVFELSPGKFILNNKGERLIADATGKQALPFTGFGGIYYDDVNNQYAFESKDGWMIAAADGTVKTKVDANGLIYNGGVYFLSKTTDTAGTLSAVMNGNGNIVVPYGKYFMINTAVKNGLICVGIKTGESPSDEPGITYVNQKIGYVDVTGKEIVPLQFEDVMFDFSEGLAVVQQNGKKGFIDTTGKLVIEAKYDKAENFVNGFAKVWEGTVPGIIDKKGNTIY